MAALRADIAAATGCTASAGIGPNLLLARLATRRAKPDGQLRVTVEQARPRPGRARGSDPAGQAACCRAARSRITHPRCTGDQPCAGSWAGVPPPGAAGIGAVQPNPALPCMNPKYTQADVAAGLGGRRPARHGASHAREAGRGSPQPYVNLSAPRRTCCCWAWRPTTCRAWATPRARSWTRWASAAWPTCARGRGRRCSASLAPRRAPRCVPPLCLRTVHAGACYPCAVIITFSKPGLGHALSRDTLWE